MLAISCSALVFTSSCDKDEVPDPDTNGNDTNAVVREKINTIPEFFPPDYEENYGTQMPEYKLMLDVNDRIKSPRDLAFNTVEGRENELWVLNPGTDRSGAYTVLMDNANGDDPTVTLLQDGNAWHFMALSTSLAFGDNGNWATAQGIVDANRRGGTFTGPSLWSADLNIYAKIGNPPVAGTNGSHLDMIHQSPMGMGIAHEKDNIYWVYDGYNSTLCKYDFKDPHRPGGEYHGDGEVYRYDVSVKMDPNVPSHMIMDKEKGMLFVCDAGNNRVLEVNTQTGSEKSGMPTIPLRNGEPLAKYVEMEGTQSGIFADGIEKPCGIALKENRLFVGSYATGDIICYDIETKEELGRVNTGVDGLMGFSIGPDGNIWLTANGEDAIYKMLPAEENI